MHLRDCLTGPLCLLGLIHVVTATLSKEAKEYCQGKGSICEVNEKFAQDCKEHTGSEYWKCICTSGDIPAYISCYDCLTSMGETSYGNYSRYGDNCDRENYSVAPLPSTIIKQQEARNKTATVPSMSQTAAATQASGEASIDRSYTTRFRETYTTTIYGTPTASLPNIVAATETGGSVPSRAQSTFWMTVVWVSCITKLMLMI